MTLDIKAHKAELAVLCRRHHVRRLELFGSQATGGAKQESSDIDILVDFDPHLSDGYADAYFGLAEGLEQLFGCPVDLVVASAIKNPYFRQAVDQTKTPLYAA